jgi:uncharacterized protein (TIGR00106 family)
MALLEISVMPLGTGTPSVSKYVAGAMRELQEEKDLKYEFASMGTTIEGELDRLLALARRMHETAFAAGAQRVVTTIKIDDRRDQVASIQSKLNAVKKELGQ